MGSGLREGYGGRSRGPGPPHPPTSGQPEARARGPPHLEASDPPALFPVPKASLVLLCLLIIFAVFNNYKHLFCSRDEWRY